MSNKKLLHRVFNELLVEVTPQRLISESCKLNEHKLTVMDQTYDLKPYNNVYLLGSGKAVLPMAEEMEKLLKPFITKTLFIGPYENELISEKGSYIQSSHPLPTQKSLSAAKSLLDILNDMQEDDLFIYLLSGGNSALVELPEDKITLHDFQEATKLMLHSGMPIEKINSVRKHLSQVKGGKLAMQTKAKGIVLVLSDVIGDDLYAIGSAPFYCDKSSYEEAEHSLISYDIYTKMPQSIQKFLKEAKDGLHPETPKEPFEHIDHHILGSNRIVLEKAQKLLKKEGIEAVIMDEPIQGDSSQVAKQLLTFSQNNMQTRHAYIFGGESTVTVRGDGKGGRNQHLCLNLLTQCDIPCDITFLCGATDGVDGNSNAAGALIDIHSFIDAKARQIDPQHYLDSFDSNSFFEQTGELLITGPTHNNLLDIVMVIIEPNPKERETNG